MSEKKAISDGWYWVRIPHGGVEYVRVRAERVFGPSEPLHGTPLSEWTGAIDWAPAEPPQEVFQRLMGKSEVESSEEVLQQAFCRKGKSEEKTKPSSRCWSPFVWRWSSSCWSSGDYSIYCRSDGLFHLHHRHDEIEEYIGSMETLVKAKLLAENHQVARSGIAEIREVMEKHGLDFEDVKVEFEKSR